MRETGNKRNTHKKSTLALLLVLLIAAAFFVMSDTPFIKGARDALMQKPGYEAIDQSAEEGEDDGSDSGSAAKAGSFDLEAGELPEWEGKH